MYRLLIDVCCDITHSRITMNYLDDIVLPQHEVITAYKHMSIELQAIMTLLSGGVLNKQAGAKPHASKVP